METIIRVKFHTPLPDGQFEFYFGSLAAIYERFTEAEIGCTLKTLWAANITFTQPKVTRSCVISKHLLGRKPQSQK